MKPSTNAVLIAAEFNQPLIDSMVASALDEIKQLSIEVERVIRFPGCYELPLIASAALARPTVDVLVVLGYIERGETMHGEVMGHVTHQALMQLELERSKPIGLGIIGPGATPQQAEQRKDGYARAAVRAALASLNALRELEKP